MKRSIKKKIKSKLQHFGLFIQLIPEIKIQYFPTAKSLYKYLLKQPADKKITEFKRLTDFIADAQNHKYYHSLLKEIYPEIPADFEAASFVLKNSTFSRNRKIKWKNKFYFEKNYLFVNHELESILWVDQHLYPLISKYFKIPKIIKKYEGDFSNLLYFEHLNLSPINQESPEHKLIKTAQRLYEISLKEQEKLSQFNWNPLLLNFEKLFFEENINAAKKDLLKHGIPAEKIWKKVVNSTYILAHGDLHAENVYQKNHLIDLDNFGFYPIGMDPVFIYMFYFEKQDLKISFQDWIKTHFSEIIPPENWEEFERNAVFYCFLFFHMRKDKEKYIVFHENLIQSLKNLFLV